MKKFLLFFIAGMLLAWYVSYQGFIVTLYYRIFNPYILENNSVYYNFKIVNSVPNIESNVKKAFIVPESSIKTIESNFIISKVLNESKHESATSLKESGILLTLYFHYDNTNSPVSDQKMFQIFKNIQDTWLGCGVKIKIYPQDGESSVKGAFKINSLYVDNSESNIDNDDNLNNFYMAWVSNNEFNGEAQTSGLKADSSSTSIIQSYNIRLSKEYFNLSVLQTVIIHEFGHAIGLPHSQDRNDIMFPTVDIPNPFAKQPSKNDINNCKTVLSQIDINKSQQKINND